MPHAFKASLDYLAVPFLVRLYADLGGKILEHRKEAKRLAESMKHVEAVIRLFDPTYEVSRIAARKLLLFPPARRHLASALLTP